MIVPVCPTVKECTILDLEPTGLFEKRHNNGYVYDLMEDVLLKGVRL